MIPNPTQVDNLTCRHSFNTISCPTLSNFEYSWWLVRSYVADWLYLDPTVITEYQLIVRNTLVAALTEKFGGVPQVVSRLRPYFDGFC